MFKEENDQRKEKEAKRILPALDQLKDQTLREKLKEKLTKLIHDEDHHENT